MHVLAMDSVKKNEETSKPLSSLPKVRYTPYTLKLIRRLRRIVFPGRRLDRMAKSAREALERCEQIGKCNLDT